MIYCVTIYHPIPCYTILCYAAPARQLDLEVFVPVVEFDEGVLDLNHIDNHKHHNNHNNNNRLISDNKHNITIGQSQQQQ